MWCDDSQNETGQTVNAEHDPSVADEEPVSQKQNDEHLEGGSTGTTASEQDETFPRRSLRIRRPPKWHKDHICILKNSNWLT